MLRAPALLLSSLAGLASAVSDPSGLSTVLGYVVRVFEPDGNVRELRYDGEDNVVALDRFQSHIQICAKSDWHCGGCRCALPDGDRRPLGVLSRSS